MGGEGWVRRGVSRKGAGEGIVWALLLRKEAVGGGKVIGWALTDTNDAAEGGAPLGANCNATPHRTAPLGFTMYINSCLQLRVTCN